MRGSLATTRTPHWDRGLWLVSIKAGLRATALAALTWAMVPEAHGQIAEAIQLQNRASKGTTGGCTMPLHQDLQVALATLQPARGDTPHSEQAVLCSERQCTSGGPALDAAGRPQSRAAGHGPDGSRGTAGQEGVHAATALRWARVSLVGKRGSGCLWRGFPPGYRRSAICSWAERSPSLFCISLMKMGWSFAGRMTLVSSDSRVRRK